MTHKQAGQKRRRVELTVVTSESGDECHVECEHLERTSHEGGFYEMGTCKVFHGTLESLSGTNYGGGPYERLEQCKLAEVPATRPSKENARG